MTFSNLLSSIDDINIYHFVIVLRIYLMGQSAGAHISACALMDQAVKEANGERISWSVSQIKAYFGLSGGYLII